MAKYMHTSSFDESGLIDEVLLALVGIHGDLFVDINDRPGSATLSQSTIESHGSPHPFITVAFTGLYICCVQG